MARDHYEKAVYRNYSPGADFQEQISRHASMRGSECEVDLTDYHTPDYSVLTESQLAYYLHWRDMLSEGVCLSGCKGFVFLRITEIINSDMDPSEGLAEMMLMADDASHMGMGVRSIIDSMFDYCIVKGLPLKHNFVTGSMGRAMVVSEIMEFPASPCGRSAVSILCNGQDDSWPGIDPETVYNLFLSVLPTLDDHVKRISGRSLSEQFSTGRVTESYMVFSSDPYFGEKNYALTFNRFNEFKLIRFCTALYRCCAKVVGKAVGVKGPSVPTSFGPDMRRIVDDVFHCRIEPLVPDMGVLKGSFRTPLSAKERALMDMGIALGVNDPFHKPDVREPILFESPRIRMTGPPEDFRRDMVVHSMDRGFPCPYIPSGGDAVDYAFLPPGALEYHAYWRSMFLQGTVMDTDTGYLRLFIAEMVNSSGNPRQVLDILVRLNEFFGGTVHGRALTGPAVFDYAVVNNLPLSEPVIRRMEVSVCMIMEAYLRGKGPEPTASCYETIHASQSGRAMTIYDDALVAVLNRVVLRISRMDSPDPTLPYGMLGSRMLPPMVIKMCPFDDLPYFGPHADSIIRVHLMNFLFSGWAGALADLANYARRYIDKPSSRRRLKSPMVFGVDVGPLVAEEVAAFEGRTEADRRLKAATSMRLDMDAVLLAENDLRDVTEMMSVEDDTGEVDDVHVESSHVESDDDPWSSLVDSIGEDGVEYLRKALSGTRSKPPLERRINDMAMKYVGDVVVQDGVVIEDYHDIIEGSLEGME